MKLHTIFSKAKNLPKKILTPALIAVLTVPVALGPLVSADPTVLMEGWTKSLNVTAGETTYHDSTNAMVDDVVQVELWQHNRENPAGPQAQNTKVKFTVPNQQGKTQVITGTSSSDNGNTISDSTTIHTTLDRNTVEYMPGTAKFKYNKGAANGDASCETGFNFPPDRCFATVTISDNVVTTGVNLDTIRGGKLRGCNAHHETVTIQVRVKASVVSINKYVRHKGQGADDWKLSTDALPGDELEYKIRFKNEGNTDLNAVMIGDNMPKYNSYVNGTTVLYNGNHPDGLALSNDNIVHGGINVGSYGAGAVGYVIMRVKIDPINVFEKCGTYTVHNVGVVRPEGMNEFYNTAFVNINVICKPGQERLPNQPKPTTPSSLPNTGPGEVVAAFVAVSTISGLAYRVVVRRLYEV